MSQIHNERTKLLANAFDRASTACLTVGILAPIAAAIYTPVGIAPVLGVVVSCAGWLAAAIALHLLARRVLGQML